VRLRPPLPPALALLLLALAPATAPAAVTVTLQPAAGPAGTRAKLTGRHFPKSSHVVIRVGRRLAARPRVDRTGTFRTTLKLARPGTITTRSARRTRVVNHFRGASGADTGEIAGPAGAYVRWTPLRPAPGEDVHLTGAGFKASRTVTIAVAGLRIPGVHTDAAGRFAATITAKQGTVVVRQDDARLPVPLPNVGGGITGPPQTTPGAALSFPIRAAFYYPWFPEGWSGPGGLYPATHFHPLLGYYQSSDPATMATHLSEMAYAKIQVAISSWWGQGSATDLRLGSLLQRTRAVGSGVRWAIYYEMEGTQDPSPTRISDDLRYIREKYGSDPSYLRVAGRPVVFAFSSPDDGCGMADRWHLGNSGRRMFVVLQSFPGAQTCTFQPDGWHQYGPSKREVSAPGEFFSISPGFWLGTEPTPRLARDPACFRRAVRDMVASHAPWQLVTTFSEWGEGTAVEPAQEWATPSGYGAYLDALHDDGLSGTVSVSPC
jgi:Glycosyl hydrolase family 99